MFEDDDELFESKYPTIYCGNLPFNTKTEELENLFSRFGKIIRVKKYMPEGKFRGVAFIEMERMQDAEDAVKTLNKQIFGERTLKVSIAERKGPSRDRKPPPPPLPPRLDNRDRYYDEKPEKYLSSPPYRIPPRDDRERDRFLDDRDKYLDDRDRFIDNRTRYGDRDRYIEDRRSFPIRDAQRPPDRYPAREIDYAPPSSTRENDRFYPPSDRYPPTASRRPPSPPPYYPPPESSPRRTEGSRGGYYAPPLSDRRIPPPPPPPYERYPDPPLSDRRKY